MARTTLIVLSALLHFKSFASCLEMTVAPEKIAIDATPSFSLNCGMTESDEVKVLSLSISRRTFYSFWGGTAAGANSDNYAPELIASLSYTSPVIPRVSASFPQLTVEGQITAQESEVGTYLNISWPSPSIKDLGIYICSVTYIADSGRMETRTANTEVTTSNPGVDRLLVIASSLQARTAGYGNNYVDFKAIADNVAASESSNFEADDNVEESSGDEELPFPASAAATTVPSPTPLDRQTRSAVGYGFPSGVATQTGGFLDTGDLIQNFFQTGSSTYFLVKGMGNRSAYQAQGACQSKGLFLAFVKNGLALQKIGSKLAPMMNQHAVVVVAGQRNAGMGGWPHQNTGVMMNAWTHNQSAWTRQCNALRMITGGVVTMATVPCSQYSSNLFYLCVDAL